MARSRERNPESGAQGGGLEVEPVVFLVDDDGDFQGFFSSMFSTLGVHVSVHQAAPSFLEAYDHRRPSCVVLDPRMPRVGGRALLKNLGTQRFSPPVIVVTAQADLEGAVELMKLGAIDFMTKPVREQRLVDAVSRAFEMDAARRPAFRELQSCRARVDRLTTREREVMELLAGGKTNAQVAVGLGISPRTVELHRARINSKLGVRSLVELVALVTCFRQGEEQEPAF